MRWVFNNYFLLLFVKTQCDDIPDDADWQKPPGHDAAAYKND
jgi:hypothetical protein